MDGRMELMRVTETIEGNKLDGWESEEKGIS